MTHIWTQSLNHRRWPLAGHRLSTSSSFPPCRLRPPPSPRLPPLFLAVPFPLPLPPLRLHEVLLDLLSCVVFELRDACMRDYALKAFITSCGSIQVNRSSTNSPAPPRCPPCPATRSGSKAEKGNPVSQSINTTESAGCTFDVDHSIATTHIHCKKTSESKKSLTPS